MSIEQNPPRQKQNPGGDEFVLWNKPLFSAHRSVSNSSDQTYVNETKTILRQLRLRVSSENREFSNAKRLRRARAQPGAA
jgi:hypothetical protein